MADNEKVNVRVFNNLFQIQSEAGFKDDNAVSKDTYSALLGDYNFPDVEVKCCYLKENGKLCAQDHKRGLVVRLQDRTVSIVGNCCGKTKLGEIARSNITQYENEQKRRDRFIALESLLSSKEQTLYKLNSACEDVKKLSGKIDQFLNELGGKTQKKLQDMGKTGNATVFITAINEREYVDEEGRKQVERTATKLRLGAFSAISVLNKNTFHSVFSDVRLIKDAFDDAGKLTVDSKVSAIGAINARISFSENVIKRNDEISNLVDQFFENDFSLLCFLVEDKVERYKSAKFALEKTQGGGGRDKAKEWLFQKEQQLKIDLRADKLEIA